MARPTKTQQVEITRRRTRAIQLRNDGWPWQAIADELAYDSAASACGDVNRAMEQAAAELRESAEVMRERELVRLDEMRHAALQVLRRRHLLVSGGKVVRDLTVNDDGSVVGDLAPLEDDGPTLAALDRLVKVSESMRRLLGLDAPQKVETTGKISYTIDGVTDPGALT